MSVRCCQRPLHSGLSPDSAVPLPTALGFLGPLLTIGLLLAIGVGLLAVALASLDLNSSGRGLDTDEWEVDHSVWMNQLQKDFEDSWSTE